MQNLNEYNEEKFKNEFENTSLCQQITKDFDRIVWSKNYDYVSICKTTQCNRFEIFWND